MELELPCWFTVNIPQGAPRLTSLQRITTLSEKSKNNPKILVHFENDRACFRFVNEQMCCSLIEARECKINTHHKDTYIVQYGKDVKYCKFDEELFEHFFPERRWRRLAYTGLLSNDKNKWENDAIIYQRSEVNFEKDLKNDERNSETIGTKTSESQFEYTLKVKEKFKEQANEASAFGRPATNAQPCKEKCTSNSVSVLQEKLKSVNYPLKFGYAIPLPNEGMDVLQGVHSVCSEDVCPEHDGVLHKIDHCSEDLNSPSDGTEMRRKTMKQFTRKTKGTFKKKSRKCPRRRKRTKLFQNKRWYKSKQIRLRKLQKKKSALKYTSKGCAEIRLKDQEVVKRCQKKAFRIKKWSWNTDDNFKKKYMLDEDALTLFKETSNKYNKEMIKMLRELTDLPCHERTWKVNAYVYPSRRGKSGESSHGGNQQDHTDSSQAAEGIPDQYPTQESDAATGSLNLPPSELVQTSLGSIFQTYTSNTPVPTTNLMPSIDAERGLVSRIRGQLPESRFSQPQQPPRHPQYADQPSRHRLHSNWPTTNGQGPSSAANNYGNDDLPTPDLILPGQREGQERREDFNCVHANCTICLVRENQRLNAIMRCQSCRENLRNILFLPCQHHRLCEACAEGFTICPYCGMAIDEKITTVWSDFTF